MILNKLKSLALLAAMAIVAMTAVPQTATALDKVCKDSGTECHAEINGQIYDLREYL